MKFGENRYLEQVIRIRCSTFLAHSERFWAENQYWNLLILLTPPQEPQMASIIPVRLIQGSLFRRWVPETRRPYERFPGSRRHMIQVEFPNAVTVGES